MLCEWRNGRCDSWPVLREQLRTFPPQTKCSYGQEQLRFGALDLSPTRQNQGRLRSTQNLRNRTGSLYVRVLAVVE